MYQYQDYDTEESICSKDDFETNMIHYLYKEFL